MAVMPVLRRGTAAAVYRCAFNQGALPQVSLLQRPLLRRTRGGQSAADAVGGDVSAHCSGVRELRQQTFAWWRCLP